MSTPAESDFDPRAQLLPNLIDHYAKTKPDAIYAEYPINPMSYDQGYRQISYKAFANVINGIAQWLTETMGPGNGEVLCYVGGNDLRYPALVMGAIKAGYVMLLTSPRNSGVANKSLLEKLNCKTLLTPVPRPPFIAGILAAHSLETVDIPSLQTLLTTEYPQFVYEKTYPEDKSDPLVVLHTSGTTGIPKPIIWTHESAVRHMHMQALEVPKGVEVQDSFEKRVFVTLPAFHAAGLASILFIPLPANQTVIMPTAVGLPTAAAMVAARKQTQFHTALAVPSIVAELAQYPELLDYCSANMESLMYAGGDLPQQIGDTVAAKLRLANHYGATEMGLLKVIFSSHRDPLVDWRYLEFHPEIGVEFRHVSGNEYEAIIMHSPEKEINQCPFVLFPELQEYHSKDLMIPHPTKANLWRPSGRVDDVIVFLNGEKTNPCSMEQSIVSSNADITACVVIGAQRFQASLLIEVGEKSLSASDRAQMIEQLWPSIEEANTEAPAHARITKSHILFASPEKPFPRTPKGTINRPQTLVLYAKEIKDLYNDAEKLGEVDEAQTQIPDLSDLQDATKVAEYIKASILAITKWSPEQLTTTENWFNLGLDSLQAIRAVRVLKRGLSLPVLTPNTIYLNPTIESLTQALQSLRRGSGQNNEAKKQAQIQERDQLLQELTAQIDPKTQKETKTAPSHQTVILTGSTGQLGSYLLSALLKSPKVEHVYCLNRDEKARERQVARSSDYGLASTDEARVTFWKADFSQKNLELEKEQVDKLQQTATHIIHNAWAVNFNLSLASFKPHLSGVVNLINLASEGVYTPRLFFISSISSILGHKTDSGLIPETLIETSSLASNGYADSKYVAEQLLGYASKQALVPSAFARVGQVAGSIRSPGLWSKSEWFPSLVLSSIHIGALPGTLGGMDRVDWVPIDLLAEVLVDLTFDGKFDAELGVYHPINLSPKQWKELLPLVADAVQASFGKTLQTITASEWVQRVHQAIELATKADGVIDEKKLYAHLEKNPAAKLLQFFEDVLAQTPLSVLDTKETAEGTQKLRDVQAIQPEWIQKWVREWSE
ncbi:acetyl-CoA synthetase-like protein [Penicillium malachiteum]|nr:acetyl-CoA synthetase-like protein [Penicillium malachiteum]